MVARLGGRPFIKDVKVEVSQISGKSLLPELPADVQAETGCQIAVTAKTAEIDLLIEIFIKEAK